MLESELKSGVVLCEVACAISPGIVKRISDSPLPYKQMDNIAAFSSACRRLGVPEHDCFDTIDLFEGKDIVAVVQTIHALGRTVQLTREDLPKLGPRLATKNKREFTDAQLRRASISEVPMPIAPGAVAPDDFRGGWFNVSFAVPRAIADQLAARKRALNLNWAPREYNASWLVPSRLLMYASLRAPDDAMALDLLVDGERAALTRAYNSRGLPRPNCFLGFYFDASALAVETPHDVALRLPAGLAEGRFEGLFWENIETPTDVAPATACARFY